MAQALEKIPDEFARWFESQPVFFVATAAADPGAHVNVSPRGLDTFRVLGPNRVAWLDLTGSGVETIAHLKADGRITLMFCAFDNPPKVVRLYGRGRVHEPGDDAHEELRPRFPDLPGARALVDVAVDRVSSSCGFGVPLMKFVGPRTELPKSAERKGEAKMAAYRARKNAESIDGCWTEAIWTRGFREPLIGAGSMADVGIDDDFIKQVREKVTEGTSALFALTSGATAPDKIIDELKQYDFEIISTNLPEEQEKQLREAFAQE